MGQRRMNVDPRDDPDVGVGDVNGAGGSDDEELSDEVLTAEFNTVDTDGLSKLQATIAVIGAVLIAVIGLLGGLAAIGFGGYLLVKGVTGDVDVSVSSGKTQAEVKTAAIGLVMAIIGAVVIWLTGMSINKRVKQDRKG